MYERQTLLSRAMPCYAIPAWARAGFERQLAECSNQRMKIDGARAGGP